MFNWFNFLTYVLITAFTPGPNNIISMVNGSHLGFKKSMPFNLGIVTGLAFITAVAMIFGSILTTYIPKIKMPMLILGALYILYLAFETFRSSGEMEGSRSRSSFLTGILLQFINPKLYLYSLMSLEAYVLPFYHGQPLPLLGFGAILVGIAFCASLSWTAFGSAFKRLFSLHAKKVNTVLALLLVYCAISLFL